MMSSQVWICLSSWRRWLVHNTATKRW